MKSPLQLYHAGVQWHVIMMPGCTALTNPSIAHGVHCGEMLVTGSTSSAEGGEGRGFCEGVELMQGALCETPACMAPETGV
jgi:hypothetical protein